MWINEPVLEMFGSLLVFIKSFVKQWQLFILWKINSYRLRTIEPVSEVFGPQIYILKTWSTTNNRLWIPEPVSKKFGSLALLKNVEKPIEAVCESLNLFMKSFGSSNFLRNYEKPLKLVRFKQFCAFFFKKQSAFQNLWKL